MNTSFLKEVTFEPGLKTEKMPAVEAGQGGKGPHNQAREPEHTHTRERQVSCRQSGSGVWGLPGGVLHMTVLTSKVQKEKAEQEGGLQRIRACTNVGGRRLRMGQGRV